MLKTVFLLLLLWIVVFAPNTVANADSYDPYALSSDLNDLHAAANENDPYLRYGGFWAYNLNGVDSFLMTKYQAGQRPVTFQHPMNIDSYKLKAWDINFADEYTTLLGLEDGNTVFTIANWNGELLKRICVEGILSSCFNTDLYARLTIDDIAIVDSGIFVLISQRSLIIDDVPNFGWYAVSITNDGIVCAEKFFHTQDDAPGLLLLHYENGRYYVQVDNTEPYIAVLDENLEMVETLSCITDAAAYSVNDVDVYDDCYYLSITETMKENDVRNAMIAKVDKTGTCIAYCRYESQLGSSCRGLNVADGGLQQNVFEVLEQSPDYYSDSAVRLKHLQVSYNCDLNVLSQTFIGEYETTQLY